MQYYPFQDLLPILNCVYLCFILWRFVFSVQGDVLRQTSDRDQTFKVHFLLALALVKQVREPHYIVVAVYLFSLQSILSNPLVTSLRKEGDGSGEIFSVWLSNGYTSLKLLLWFLLCRELAAMAVQRLSLKGPPYASVKRMSLWGSVGVKIQWLIVWSICPTRFMHLLMSEFAFVW